MVLGRIIIDHSMLCFCFGFMNPVAAIVYIPVALGALQLLYQMGSSASLSVVAESSCVPPISIVLRVGLVEL